MPKDQRPVGMHDLGGGVVGEFLPDGTVVIHVCGVSIHVVFNGRCALVRRFYLYINWLTFME